MKTFTIAQQYNGAISHHLTVHEPMGCARDRAVLYRCIVGNVGSIGRWSANQLLLSSLS